MRTACSPSPKERDRLQGWREPSDALKCVTLDSTISEAPSYMKFDIEGFEPEALEGARRLITQYRPRLGRCAYHVQDHLWKLPLLIHSLNSTLSFLLAPARAGLRRQSAMPFPSNFCACHEAV